MAEYIKQEMNDLDGSGKKRTFYRMKTYQRINMREFVSELAQPGSGLSEGSVLHVLRWPKSWLITWDKVIRLQSTV